MNPIRTKLTRLKKTILIISKLLAEIVQEERNFIANLNREQLSKGDKADDSSMPRYVQGSKSPSSPGKITLFDTGEFHASIEPLFDDRQFELLSTDEKAEILVGKYGEILGLNEESLNLLAQRIKPKLIGRIKALI